MIEATLLDYLKNNIPDLKFGMERKDKTDVVLSKSPGGDHVNFLYASPFLVYVYGKSEANVAERSKRIISVLEELSLNEPEVTKCEIGIDYSAPDAATNEYRYKIPITIYHY